MKRILAAALAVTLMTGSLMAEARDHDRRDRHSHRDERGWHRDHDRHARGVHHRERAAARHHVRYRAGHYHRPPGYRHHAWHRGAHLPRPYFATRYVVHDYRSYRLHRPPHGHHWVRVDRDVVLAAIATGVVVAVVNDLFY